MKIVWSAQARRDLKAIRSFIARDSEFYALRQMSCIVERVESLTGMPSRGHPVHELPALALREIHEGSYRIIYSVAGDALRVVTIVHMKQRLESKRLK